MATTHVLAGVVLAAVATVFVPGVGLTTVVAAALGGLLPDFDLYAGHRKTLHYPVYFSIAAIPAAALAAAIPTTATLSVALFVAAAALHSVMDVAGGGLELKPWLGTSDRAVYDHFRGRWIAPKRWIRYDGAPADLALAGVLAVPSLLVFDGPIEAGVLVALAVSAVYVAVRKSLVVAAERLVPTLPVGMLDRLPDRFVEDFR